MLNEFQEEPLDGLQYHYKRERKVKPERPPSSNISNLPKTRTDEIVERSAVGMFQKQSTSKMIRQLTHGKQDETTINEQQHQQTNLDVTSQSLPTQEDSLIKSAEQQFEDKMLTLHSNFDELSKEVLRTKYSRLLVLIDVVVAALASAMMALGIIESTHYNQILNPEEERIMGYRFTLTILALLTSGMVILRNRILIVKQFYQRRLINKSFCQKHIRTQTILTLTLELIIILINPVPMADLEFSPRQQSLGEKTYSVDQFFTAFSLAKCVFLLRLIPHLTEIKNDVSRKVYELNGVAVDSALFVRIQLKDRPFIIQSIVLTLMTLQFGFATQLFERTEGSIPDGFYDPFRDASNSLWCVILGMTTVGYGDLMPVTHIGRLFVILACFAGSFIITLMTVTVSIKINHDERQLQAFNFILNFKRKRQLRIRAANVIARFYHYTFDKSTQVKQKEPGNEDSRTEMLGESQMGKSQSAQEGFITKKMKLQQAVDAFREQLDFFGMANINGIDDEKRQLLSIDHQRDVKFHNIRQSYSELNPKHIRQVNTFGRDFQAKLLKNARDLRVQTGILSDMVGRARFIRGSVIAERMKRQEDKKRLEAQREESKKEEANKQKTTQDIVTRQNEDIALQNQVLKKQAEVIEHQRQQSIKAQSLNKAETIIESSKTLDRDLTVPIQPFSESPHEPILRVIKSTNDNRSVIPPPIERPESQISLTSIQIKPTTQSPGHETTQNDVIMEKLTKRVDLQVQKYLDQIKAKEIKILVGQNLKELINMQPSERPGKIEELKQKQSEEDMKKETAETTFVPAIQNEADENTMNLEEDQEEIVQNEGDRPSNNQEENQQPFEDNSQKDNEAQSITQEVAEQLQIIPDIQIEQQDAPELSQSGLSTKSKKRKKKVQPLVHQQSSLSILPSSSHKPIIKPIYVKPTTVAQMLNNDLPMQSTNVYENEEVRKLLNFNKKRDTSVKQTSSTYSFAKVVPIIIEKSPAPQQYAYLSHVKDIDPHLWVAERTIEQYQSEQKIPAQSSFHSLWDNANQRQEVLKMEHLQRTKNPTNDKLTAKVMNAQMNVVHGQIRVQTYGAPNIPTQIRSGLQRMQFQSQQTDNKAIAKQRFLVQDQLMQKYVMESVHANDRDFEQQLHSKRRKEMQRIIEGLYQRQ